MRICALCGELEKHPFGADPWNIPLFSSDNFVALPSVGPLVEGWLLLVPKDHFISIGALPDHLCDEMNAFRRVLQSALTECYGSVVAFEHGPSQERRSVGCGVDHAHLHLVPVSFDLATFVSPMLPSGASWKPAGIEDCRNCHRRGEDYLYLEQPLGLGRIATGDMGSQLFRRVIASQTGNPEEYNWREHPQLDSVMATISRIRAWQESSASEERGILFAAA
jgi:ATP adenylyltransferase